MFPDHRQHEPRMGKSQESSKERAHRKGGQEGAELSTLGEAHSENNTTYTNLDDSVSSCDTMSNCSMAQGKNSDSLSGGNLSAGGGRSEKKRKRQGEKKTQSKASSSGSFSQKGSGGENCSSNSWINDEISSLGSTEASDKVKMDKSTCLSNIIKLEKRRKQNREAQRRFRQRARTMRMAPAHDAGYHPDLSALHRSMGQASHYPHSISSLADVAALQHGALPLASLAEAFQHQHPPRARDEDNTANLRQALEAGIALERQILHMQVLKQQLQQQQQKLQQLGSVAPPVALQHQIQANALQQQQPAVHNNQFAGVYQHVAQPPPHLLQQRQAPVLQSPSQLQASTAQLPEAIHFSQLHSHPAAALDAGARVGLEFLLRRQNLNSRGL